MNNPENVKPSLWKKIIAFLAVLILLISSLNGVGEALAQNKKIAELNFLTNTALSLEFSSDPLTTFNLLSAEEQNKVKEVILFHFKNLQDIVDREGTDHDIHDYIDSIPYPILYLMQADIEYLGFFKEYFLDNYLSSLNLLPPYQAPSDSKEVRLNNLLLRIDEFNSFNAEERALVLEYYGLSEEITFNEEEDPSSLSEDSSSSLDKIKDLERIFENPSFSSLSLNTQNELLSLLSLDSSKSQIISSSFSYLEDLGYNLKESADIIRIASSGLFLLDEAIALYEAYLGIFSKLLFELKEFETFSKLFNIAAEVNDNRLKDYQFISYHPEPEDNTPSRQPSSPNIIDSVISQQPWREDSDVANLTEVKETLYLSYTSFSSFNTAKDLFLEGYLVNDIKQAFFLASALNLDPKDVISSDAKSILSYALGLSSFSKTASAGINLADLNSSEYEEMLLILSFGASIMYMGMMLMSGGGSEDIIAPFIAYLNGNEAVNLNTGAVLYHENILNVPGRNGMDLILGITYDSSEAELYKATVDYSSYDVYSVDVYLNISIYINGILTQFDGYMISYNEFYSYYSALSFYNDVNSWPDDIDNETITITNFSDFWYWSETSYYYTDWPNHADPYGDDTCIGFSSTNLPYPSPWNYSNSDGYLGTLSGPYFISLNSSQISWTDENHYSITSYWSGEYYGTVKKIIDEVWHYYATSPQYEYTDYSYFNTTSSPTKYEELWNCGAGWSFDLPYIYDNTLSIPNKGTYQLSGFNILDNPLQDMTLVNNNSNNVYFGGGSTAREKSYYKLTFKDGTVYHFNSSGQFIAQQDRFGNTIVYKYTQQASFNNRYLLSSIIDTTGAVYTLAYTTSGSNRVVTVTSPDNSTYKMNLSPISSHNGKFNLSSVVNQGNVTTSFTYQTDTASFNFDTYYMSSVNNYTSLLKTVTYQTGTQLLYNYSKVSLSSGSYNRQFHKLSSRTFSDGITTDYLKTDYTYSGNHLNPGSSTYSTSVINNLGVKTTYTFNSNHLNTVKDTYVNNVLVQKVQTAYNNYKLPSQVTTSAYHSSFTRSNTELFTYDSKGNLLTYTSPRAEGSSSSLYQTVFTYDTSYYSLLLSSVYSISNSVTVKEEYTLSNDHKTMTNLKTYEVSNNTPVLKAQTDYLYDAYGNVTEIRQYPDVSGAPNTCNSTIIAYNNGVKPFSISVTGILDADGQLANGTGIVSESFTYSSMWRLLSYTDGEGNTIQYQYDNLGRVTLITYPDSSFETYVYDDTLNKVTFTNVLGEVYVYQYDKFGNLLTLKDSDNTTLVTNVYDNRGRLLTSSNVLGLDTSSIISYTYDSYDRVLLVTHKDSQNNVLYQETYVYYDVLDNTGASKAVSTIIGEVNAPSIETYSIYDKYGRLKEEGITGGSSVSYFYDHLNRLINQTSPVSDNTYVYDIFGNVLSVTNIENNTLYNTYDSLGRLTSASDFKGNYTLYTYDSLGRLIKDEIPLEQIGQTTYYSIAKTYYDASSNVIKSAVNTNEAGSTISWSISEYTYTVDGFLQSSSVSNLFLVEYTYDLAGNITSQEIGDQLISYLYNSKGQLIETTDALFQTETYVYDSNGYLVSFTDRNGSVTEYFYNALGQVLSVVVTDSENNISTLYYEYYKTGSLKSEENDTLAVTYFYDSLGRTVRILEDDGVEKLYSYDNDGFLDSFTLAKDNIIIQEVDYTYDIAGRLETVSEDNSVQATYSYDQNGNRASLVYANGITTSYSYNLANMVTSVQNKLSNTVLSSFSYSYFLDGNQKSKTDHSNLTTNYTYDQLGRLLSEAEGSILTKTYSYDQYSNRSSLTVSGSENYTVDYLYNLNNRLTEELKTENSSITSSLYFYDPNGNLTAKTTDTFSAQGNGSSSISFEGVGTEFYLYNSFNQLVSINIDNDLISYDYRPDGLRYSKTLDDNIVVHLWNGSSIVADLVNNQGYISYLRGIGLISFNDGVDIFFYLFNAHGDVIQLTDDQGAVTQTYAYDSFGVEDNPSSSDFNPFRYASYYLDLESGSYYLQARYYDPSLGRFLSEDPAFDGLNWYTYCANSPLLFIDPSGLATAYIPPRDNENYIIPYYLGDTTTYTTLVDQYSNIISTGPIISVPQASLTPQQAGYMNQHIFDADVREDRFKDLGSYNNALAGWQLIDIKGDVYDDGSMGYRIGVYARIVNGVEVEYAIVFRGTKGIASIIQDVASVLGLSSAMRDSMQFSIDFEAAHRGYPITFTGHSIGGPQAQAGVVAVFNASGRIYNCITFNPAVIDLWLYDLSMKGYSGTITNYVVKYEYATFLFPVKHVGTTIYLPAKDPWKIISNHDMKAVMWGLERRGIR